MWNIPISSCEVSKVRPSSSHQHLKNTHVRESRWCLQRPRVVLMWHHCDWSNMKVCVLGSVSMLGQHILLFNSWSSHSPLFFGQFFLRFENQSFPNFLCSKSCNSVITHPSARPPKMFRKHVVLLEIPYPRMCFFWWRTSARVWIKRNDGPPQVILRPHETLDSSGYYLENSYTHIHIYIHPIAENVSLLWQLLFKFLYQDGHVRYRLMSKNP